MRRLSLLVVPSCLVASFAPSSHQQRHCQQQPLFASSDNRRSNNNNNRRGRRRNKSRDKPAAAPEASAPPKPSKRAQKANQSAYSSLLPPPLSDTASPEDDDSFSSGLSSWEKFLGGSSLDSSGPQQQQLPSIDDLFPPELSSSSTEFNNANNATQPTLDGVLPVSALFYRQHDDEELPFSAAQSDAAVVVQKAVRSRNSPANKKKGSRKLIRRGMEMLVGGSPINADPPQRSVDLCYEHSHNDWAQTIALNTRDFGPLLHRSSIAGVTAQQRGLFLEYWAQSALKWDVCPTVIRQMVKEYSGSGRVTPRSTKPKAQPVPEEEEDPHLWNEPILLSSDSGENHGIYSVSGGELHFEIGVSRDELLATDSESFEVFQDVIAKGISTALQSELKEMKLEMKRLAVKDIGDGTSEVYAEFGFQTVRDMGYDAVQKASKRICAAFVALTDDGRINVALANAAREEKRWSEVVRDRVVEECLFEDEEEEDLDESADSSDATLTEDFPENDTDEDSSPLFVVPESELMYPLDDIFADAINSGVFKDFSVRGEEDAPYGGNLGPRLLDATIERAKQRQPRVIAIGDVHGCIDELQDLLRQCDYQPGDLVVFLGDLVCKGPDSISVVQMAREIGAIGVRGNHDFEVIRWHQAIKSGVDPPVVGSEHFHIASCLTKADLKWLYSLPWYLSSKELSTLFVHAGFVSGIRLAKQNPRLMMNMRSILPDGTVTSKFFNNWPWARLWDGPQTVLFGHDADRGLQQYEHAIGLDTGCVYGGRLTACILPEKRLVSVSARREYFRYRRKHYD